MNDSFPVEEPSRDPLQLLFLNPALREPGVPQVTVRRGAKWLDTDGQRITIRATGDADVEIAAGYIQSTSLSALVDVPQSALDDEHDEACRTPDGLFEAMRRAYPDITLEENVTIVVFFVDEPTPSVDEMVASLEAEEAAPPQPSIADELAEFQTVLDFVPATFTRLFSGNGAGSLRRGVKQVVPGPAVARDKESGETRPIRIVRVSVLRYSDLTLTDAWESGLQTLDELRQEMRGFYPGLGDDFDEMVTMLRIGRV